MTRVVCVNTGNAVRDKAGQVVPYNDNDDARVPAAASLEQVKFGAQIQDGEELATEARKSKDRRSNAWI